MDKERTYEDSDFPVNPNNPVIVEYRSHVDGRIEIRHCYWCPGCDGLHCVRIRDQGPNPSRPSWNWDGNREKPTYEPSQLTTYGMLDIRCHTFIRQGQIQYLDDCTHDLRGKMISMVPVPDWVVEDAVEER